MSEFTGRAEVQVEQILRGILDVEEIWDHPRFQTFLSKSDADRLKPSIVDHKFDLAVVRKNDILVIEVNFKHGPIKYKQWSNTYVPYLEVSKEFLPKKVIPVAINDWDCRSLFKHERDSTDPIRITDVIDVCDALYAAGVKTI